MKRRKWSGVSELKGGRRYRAGSIVRTVTACLLFICMMLGGCLTALAAEPVTVNLLETPYEISEGGQTPDRNGYVYYQANQAEEWIEFALPDIVPGKYKVSVIMKKHDNNGIFQTSLNGENIGQPVNHHGSNSGDIPVELGEISIDTSKNNKARFTALENEWKKYRICIKSLKLDPVNQGGGDLPIPDVEFGEKKISESGNVVSWPMPYVYEESADFKVTADGVEVPVTKYDGWYDYANFSMKGENADGSAVTVEIEYKDEISNYEISPRKLGLEGETDGKKLTFVLERDEYLIIKINNSGRRLVLLADPWEEEYPESSGEGIFNVFTDYKADRTGTNLSNAKIQKAIDDASAYGTEHNTRGVVYIPTGVYQISTLSLKSNVELYLEGGAALRLTMDSSQYKERGFKDSIGKPVLHMLHTYNNKLDDPKHPDYQNPENYVVSENIKIYGRGTIDGRGKEADAKGWLSETLVPQNCENFSADGIIFRESGVWSVNVMHSNDLEFINFKALNKLFHENDCIDVNNSQNVVVRNAIGIALDDPFSTKTWETGELFKSVCGGGKILKNVLFEDCISWTCCYGFKVGQGSNYNQENVVFKDGVVYDCSVGIGIEHKYGNAELTGITFENIDIENVTNSNGPLRNWLAFQSVSAGKDGVMPISHITVKNINVYDRGTVESRITGYDQDNLIDGIQFEKIYMDELGGYAESLADLNVKEYYMYSRELTLDGRKLPDPPAFFTVQLEALADVAELSENCPKLGIGEGFVYIGNAVGDWASFPVSLKAGTYELSVMLKKHDKKGIFQLYMNDVPVGEPYDQYYNGNKTGITANLGTITVEEDGIQNFKFKITGKNEDSLGYQLVIDALKFKEVVKEAKLEQIEIDQMPEKTTYFTGEKADFTGLTVTAVYDNGDTRALKTDEYTVEGFNTEKPGTITVTVSYEGKTAEFDLEVIDFSEDTQKAMEELTDRIASASNAEQIRETADDVTDFFGTVEAITDKVFELVNKLEQALLRLDKGIRATKTAVADEVKELFGIRAGDVKVEGAAVTAHANRFDEETASPSNAVFRIEAAEDEWELPEGYDGESAARVRFCIDVVSGDEVIEEAEPAVPVRIKLPYPTGMNGQDTIRVFQYSDSGELMERLVPELGESGLTVIVDSMGNYVIAKEDTKGPDPDEGEDENPEEPEDPDDPDTPDIPDEPGDGDDGDGEEPDTPDKPDGGDGSDSSHTSSGSSYSGKAVLSTTPGDWMKDEHGWWYRLKDGNYPKNDWVIYQGVWYYFDENGYMKTGWVLWKEKWYYLNESGACVVNTVTPDGYAVDADGAWVK